MNVNHPNQPVRSGPRTPRCLRHHVWMAYCGDCRDAHAPRLRADRELGTAQR